ncbi:MAG: Ldh family oxidoreductase [Pirellulaceae bacterium]|nr:Ldh family oxidoreductase [Pirellulaceae bacterium]
MSSTPEPTTISADELHSFCVAILEKSGVSNHHARTTADVLVATDTWGVYTHGSKLIHGYENRLRGGGLRTDVEPQIVHASASSALVDGQSALGQVTSTFAMNKAISMAKETGVGFVAVRNSCHFGAAGYYAAMAAGENMFGMSMANDVPIVAAPGSRTAVLGSNPFAYSVPERNGNHIMLDIATSIVAAGKIFAAVQSGSGKSLPSGWLIDAEGLPTTDGTKFPQEGALQPMAGHKGYGIALMVESLAGLLSGAAFTHAVGSWLFDDPSIHTDHGGTFLAVDVSSIMPLEEFFDRSDRLIQEIHETPKAKGADRIYYPGEMEWERRAHALEHGITLPGDVVAKLREVAEMVGIESSV